MQITGLATERESDIANAAHRVSSDAMLYPASSTAAEDPSSAYQIASQRLFQHFKTLPFRCNIARPSCTK